MAEPKRAQDVAARKEAHARRMVADKMRAIMRLAGQVVEWQRKADRYAKLAARTDADLEAARQKRAEQAAKRQAARVRRAIKLEGA